ncbi:hypothetical protein SAMN05444392_106147 [Seinonella peptonophila]|uniref:Uncharacterized protein n=1 Tax=Seinonella peptonophila TaxID=112248 RepID=A0A1M4YB83_9BACL|nr:hypothetical protein [Seinonella peptonophila]SHF03054.1 hypothetical protein SAMN05444392_106147 [Seinonella peptonophila]
MTYSQFMITVPIDYLTCVLGTMHRIFNIKLDVYLIEELYAVCLKEDSNTWIVAEGSEELDCDPKIIVQSSEVYRELILNAMEFWNKTLKNNGFSPQFQIIHGEKEQHNMRQRLLDAYQKQWKEIVIAEEPLVPNR